MSLSVSNDGLVAATATDAAAAGSTALHRNGVDELPIFNVERVEMNFSVAAEFVAAQIANNVMILALSNGRILRIDLKRPEDIDGTDIPGRSVRARSIRPIADLLL